MPAGRYEWLWWAGGTASWAPLGLAHTCAFCVQSLLAVLNSYLSHIE
jgi:hypothetical protein